jgi:hypothetical protein
MTCVISHPKLGIFLGSLEGLCYWSAVHSGGISKALSVESPEIAQQILDQYKICGTNDPDECEFFSVETTDWTELQKIGLNIGDMAFNDPRYAPFSVEAMH